MRFILYCIAAAVALSMGPAKASETYDLIFKIGTLSDISLDTKLRYEKSTVAAWREPAIQNTDGELLLSIEQGDAANLVYQENDKHRTIGSFPASVGNPAIMYFMETAIRDVAEATGGSPFYIRNRFKDSLLQFAEIEEISVPYQGQSISVQQVTLRPFLKDKNRGRMGEFADLELKVAVSSDVPGWYYSLIAGLPGNPADSPLYENKILILSVEE